MAKAVRRSQNGKAAGEERIEEELQKNCGQTVIDWLTELRQEVWRARQVPLEWKNATLMPPIKKDIKQYDNYRGISLLSVPGKVLALILLERLQAITDPQLMEAQCRFKRGHMCGTVDQFWAMRQGVEKAIQYKTPVSIDLLH